ncbi:MAG: DUF3455 domain-containing protein [Methylovulum sp.]|nr:DUF3455 domain-containing protein [Methylovulum sp.]
MIKKIKKIILLAAMLPYISHACPGTAVQIPEQIKVPDGHTAFLTVHAKGDQIYQCTVNQGSYLWQIQAPDARLFDNQGQIVGKHFKGPVWEYKEGSRVQGKIMAKADMAPSSAITWLLVKVVGHKGDSPFAKTSFINRINTQGGLPPVSGCDANHLGGERRVAYTADYVFYSRIIELTN